MQFMPNRYKQSSDLNLVDDLENNTPILGPVNKVAKVNTIVKTSEKDKSSKKLDIKAIWDSESGKFSTLKIKILKRKQNNTSIWCDTIVYNWNFDRLNLN